MTSDGTSLRDRLTASNPKAVQQSEAARQKELAEQNKLKARERELARWYDQQFGSRKPARVFTATVGEAYESNETSTNSSTGETLLVDYAVFPVSDVEIEEGSEITELRFRLPGLGKGWSQHSEGAITVRESGGILPDLFALEGKRLRFEGDWMPTFLDRKNFWQGTYFYRVTEAGSQPAAAAAPNPENVAALATWCAGQSRADLRGSKLLQAMQKELKVRDAGLQDIIMSNQGFIDYAIGNGLLVEQDGILQAP